MLQIYALSEKIWKLWTRDLHRWLKKTNDSKISYNWDTVHKTKAQGKTTSFGTDGVQYEVSWAACFSCLIPGWQWRNYMLVYY